MTSSAPETRDDGSTPQDSNRQTELLARALEILERDGEEAFERFCRDHPERARELRAGRARLEAWGLVGSTSHSPARADAHLGRYRILRRLGAGGMGVVYLAHDEELDRRVALKTLPPFVQRGSPAYERFRREVLAVARLDHPGIVSIHEFATHEDLPFFVMEYVPGRTLGEILRAVREAGIAPEDLSTDRLRAAASCSADETVSSSAARSWGKSHVEWTAQLVRAVALALDHAHENGIVHRDVKPSNILVGPDGRPRLFDFGLARMESSASMTLTGDFVGTSHYASPEQVSSGQRGIDARTDVYSLGATLYEALTLAPPFQGRHNAEIFRQILAHEPVSPRARNRRIPTDLETICLTAMEKNPERRYASAGAMAEDLRRFLELEPIQARPASAWTRTARLVRRNPAGGIAALLFLVLLVGTPVGLFLVNRRIRAQRDLAREARANAERALSSAEHTLDYLIELLWLADPEELGPDAPARELLRAGAEQLEKGERFADEPAVRARLMTSIGSMFWAMGDYERAGRLLRASLELQLANLGPHHPDTSSTYNFLGNLAWSLGRYEEAAGAFSRAVEALDPEEPEQADDVFTARRNLAGLLVEMGRYDEASRELALQIELLDRSPEPHPSDRFEIEKTRGFLYLRQGDPQAAADLLAPALSEAEEHGTKPSGLAQGWNLLGHARQALEAPGEAERAYRRALRLYRETGGPRTSAAGIVLAYLASSLAAQGKLADADRDFTEAIEILEETVPREHPELLRALREHARLYARDGRWEEAVELLGRARKGVADGSTDVRLAILAELSEALVAVGEPAAAVAALEEAVGLATRHLPEEDERLARLRSRLGRARAAAQTAGGSSTRR